MNDIKNNQGTKQNMTDILNRIKKENISRKADSLLNETTSASSSNSLGSNIGNLEDNDSVSGSASLTLDSVGNQSKEDEERKSAI